MKTNERFDVIIVGAGPGGEVAAGKLNREHKHVALVERELIGGECAYWACTPSKALLRPVTVIFEARHVPGVTIPHLNTAQVTDYRDHLIQHLNDNQQYTSYTSQGIPIIRCRTFSFMKKYSSNGILFLLYSAHLEGGCTNRTTSSNSCRFTPGLPHLLPSPLSS